MGDDAKTLPEDVPYRGPDGDESTRARAEHRWKARNAEIRKDVLKYDEVLNEQRKVDLRPQDPGHRRRRPRSRTEELFEETSTSW